MAAKEPKDYDLSTLNEDELAAVVRNHRAKGATDRPRYVAALAEITRRKGNGLDLDKSMELIRQAAARGRFLGYKELADASGARWERVHWAMNEHLGDLVEYSHLRGWPLISAVVVNTANVATGDMEPTTLKGFCDNARSLGFTVVDERKFLKEQQQRVFDWAQQPG